MLYDESAKDLFSRENELELEYDRICAETTFNYRGKEWTLDDIMADETLDYYTYYGLVNQYCKVLSDNLAGVYTELVRIRCDIAETIGFDSYNEYRYLCYDRDYTPDDAKEFPSTTRTITTSLILAEAVCSQERSIRIRSCSRCRRISVRSHRRSRNPISTC